LENYNEYIGKQFGKLTIIGTTKNKINRTIFVCKCSCGKITTRKLYDLKKQGDNSSCGCKRKENSFKSIFKDITGQRFGKLTVIKYEGSSKWLCKCDCGEFVIRQGGSLRNGRSHSCGCDKYKNIVHKPYKDITGQKFGKLTVIKYVDDGKWLCKCDCGKESITKGTRLKSGFVKSCGCLHHEKMVETRSNLIGQRFGKLIVIKYLLKEAKWLCRCDCGGLTKAGTTDLTSGKRISCGCLDISHYGSNKELEILNYILSFNPKIKYQKHNYSILNKKQLDLFFPEYNIAIEYNGSPFHASLNGVFENKNKFYHQKKFIDAREKGIHLITIFDIDWETKKEKIKLYLKKLLKKNQKIDSEKCKVLKISKKQANIFCEKYHLQGKCSFSSIHYGLFFQKELIAVTTLREKSENYYNLYRYCEKFDLNIKNGFEKILKYFISIFKPKCIYSNLNNDFYSGNIYMKFGFEFVKYSSPQYYWWLKEKKVKQNYYQIKNLKKQHLNLYKQAVLKNVKNKVDFIMVKLKAKKIYRCGFSQWEIYF